MRVKKVAKLNWWLVILVLVLIVTNGFWWWRERERMRVVRVIDGDTLVIKTGDRVRLSGLDAPEVGKCGATEAKTELTKLSANKIVKIENEERDTWGRRLGIVYSDSINVNLEMVRSGWARYDNFSGGGSEELRVAGQEAEAGKSGVFGLCTDKRDECDILGNIDQDTNKKYYHLPECYSYGRVKISPERGERVFCSETEAKRAGFVLVPDCVR